MNTANRLTMLRVFMIPLFLILLYWQFPFHLYIALATFILASVTDFIDGYVARHYNQITDFGKFMDPLADKVLVMAAMVWFVEVGQMPAWALLIVIVREFAVTALRLVAVDGGKVIAAGKSGKVKTASTMVCICIMLIRPLSSVWMWAFSFNQLCVAVIVATTVYSGLEYFMQNKELLNWTK
jgi:CDP-diacylglycerol--glycerol-3-phosphate 3-phosphatidyltransferase